ncbi:hypothetical protein BN1804_00241 [Proteus penneri]|uniref:Uncharacterized protein n=2 Tax=Proteus penneri TaxID=102862 RepID=A0A0G4PZV1_9GAMM|nr:hypothetical protein BN1804_00241 [Proteus penneri]
MNKKLISLANRNSINGYLTENLEVTWSKAVFNLSMVLYYFFALIGFIGWLVYVYCIYR